MRSNRELTAALQLAAMLAAMGILSAQPATPPVPLTLAQAVENSLRNYPSIRVSQEQVNAAAAAIRLARTAYLPKVDALAQVNRATRNNVFGLLLPQSVIPSMSGPVIGSNNFGIGVGQRGRRAGHLGAVRFWPARRECGGGQRSPRRNRKQR